MKAILIIFSLMILPALAEEPIYFKHHEIDSIILACAKVGLPAKTKVGFKISYCSKMVCPSFVEPEKCFKNFCLERVEVKKISEHVCTQTFYKKQLI